ncbi:hypothetical protein LTR12_009519 [Friedmanniomyces endolithicus]|nr:hypothetical protein LTR74_011626 [Friedmanniomyces endolithicus]KAK1816097.1 hypothetical protein LTR12_009519 [Friedmanniomyces endolithicus]
MSAPTSHDASVAPMTLEDLPDELIELCLQDLDKSCLRNLRLVNRFLAPRTTKYLYRHLSVPFTERGVKNCFLIVEHERLNPLVNRLTIIPSPELVPDPYENRNEGGAKLSEGCERLLRHIGRFRSLQSVEVKFLIECAAAYLPTDFVEWRVWETVGFRSEVLMGLVQGLNNEGHPATKVHDLTISNLQDVVDTTLASSEDYKAVMSRLDSLSLHIVSETDEYTIHPDFYLPEPYRFFGNYLRQYWLEPTRDKLRHLTLHYREKPWAYLPYCNLPGLHFPSLKSLSLSRMTFTDEWQVDWITSHGSTLTSLALDDCPIAHGAFVAMPLRVDRYPALQPCESARDDVSRSGEWKYHMRWYDCFQRLNEGLPHLKRFAVTYEPWWPGDTLFEVTPDSPARVAVQRYCIFNQDNKGSMWVEPVRGSWSPEDAAADTVGLRYNCNWKRLPPYPDCEHEDLEALEELLEAVRGRR